MLKHGDKRNLNLYRNTNVAFNLASPDKFLAGMLAVNRCTRASSTPAEPSVPVSQLSEAIRLAPSGTNGKRPEKRTTTPNLKY